jgi:hypothetical protein
MASRFAAFCRIWFEIKPPASSRRQGWQPLYPQKHAPARPRSQLCPPTQDPPPATELPTDSGRCQPHATPFVGVSRRDPRPKAQGLGPRPKAQGPRPKARSSQLQLAGDGKQSAGERRVVQVQVQVQQVVQAASPPSFCRPARPQNQNPNPKTPGPAPPTAEVAPSLLFARLRLSFYFF